MDYSIKIIFLVKDFVQKFQKKDGAFLYHVDNFLDILTPPSPSWTILIIRLRYVAIRPPPLPCPHGLWMPPESSFNYLNVCNKRSENSHYAHSFSPTNSDFLFSKIIINSNEAEFRVLTYTYLL